MSAVLGRGRKRQPDWFLEAENSLRPLLEAKRAAHDRLLHADNTSNRREFRKHQRMVARAVAEAKERWIKRVASTAELARRDGKHRWKSVRQLQLAFAGRKATRPTALFKEDGVETQGPDEVKQRWHGHFKKILNIPSQYQQEVVDSMPTHQTIYDLDVPPTSDELLSALGKLKNGKVGGNTGILPELIRYGGAEVQDKILELLCEVWEEGTVVGDWKDAEIVPIPKKGDLKHCDNWRGISLLDVVGKVFARILQERLQVVSEKVLPESQCGFRKGRGCTDMIFAARQLVEKCREHDDHSLRGSQEGL